MSAPAIRVEGLWKEYVVGGRERAHTTFREALVDAVSSPLRRLRALNPEEATANRFWALKDVNLEVKPGEVIGIIGRNGAGKSTLLKILSRITAPTKGRIEINGRIASLLEVGTGFHPELTGRENIRLNGAILGMSAAEIARKFDEIVAFSGVERFIDTPVKHYSSGMRVRLAFAVAAHLEPEILLIDEVLAVGDAEFQKKCLGKMGEVAGEGRTVLFVSHNMGAVQTLCPQAITLSGGAIEFAGASREAVARYLRNDHRCSIFRRQFHTNGRPQVIAASVGPISIVDRGGSRLPIDLTLRADREISINIDIRVRDCMGIPVGFATLGATTSRSPVRLLPGDSNVALSLDVSRLAVGPYRLSIDITMPFAEYHDRAEDCLDFAVGPEHWPGTLHPPRQEWQVGSILLQLEQHVVG